MVRLLGGSCWVRLLGGGQWVRLLGGEWWVRLLGGGRRVRLLGRGRWIRLLSRERWAKLLPLRQLLGPSGWLLPQRRRVGKRFQSEGCAVFKWLARGNGQRGVDGRVVEVCVLLLVTEVGEHCARVAVVHRAEKTGAVKLGCAELHADLPKTTNR